MGWFGSSEQVTLKCHKCRSSYRVRSVKSLRDGTKSTCRKCGTRFGICIIPAQEPARERPSAQVISEAPGHLSELETHNFSFWGSGGSLFGIQLVNMLLTMITFGIYSFWAKVRVREFLWSESQFINDRFAYHGTGGELLKGFLKALVVFGIPYIVLSIAVEFAQGLWLMVAGQAVVSLLVLAFIPVAVVAVRRYRLSRTSYRGIRFSFRGSAVDFMKVFLPGSILSILTLGAYVPFFDTKVRSFLTGHSYFGNQKFTFDGEGWDLSKHFLIAYFLTPFTLGLSWLGYAARRQRYFWEHTGIGPARFHYPITGWSLFKLKFVNLLLVSFTFGLAWPWVTVRNVEFVMTHLTVEGPARLDSVLQDAQPADASGEGLESFLDTGLDLA